MVTIDQLAQMCADVRSGTSSPTPDINPNSPLLAGLPSNWTVVATSAEPPFGSPDYWGHGYFAVAYRNTITGEIVIVNRGTDFNADSTTAFENAVSDGALTLGNTPSVDYDAEAFAVSVLTQLQKQNISVTNVIETGHSLGGSEAQAGVVALSSDPKFSGVSVSGVVFNSPGVGSQIASALTSPAANYNVLNIVTQGDVVHLAGGTQLGDQIQLPTLQIAYSPQSSDTSQLPQAFNPIQGQYNSTNHHLQRRRRQRCRHGQRQQRNLWGRAGQRDRGYPASQASAKVSR